MAVLAEIACNPLTTGLSHLINLGSPFLNSSKAWDCAWNIARMSSGDPHPSMSAASGWLRRSCPVCFAYLTKAISKRVWKLDDSEDVFGADDMVQWEGGWTLWVEARRHGGETVGRPPVVASQTPRGHPVPITGSALVCLPSMVGSGNGSPKRSS